MYSHIIGLWNNQGQDEKCVLVECGSSQCPPNASGRYVLLAQAAYLLAPLNSALELEPSFLLLLFLAFSRQDKA